jgi:hypothetical protein
MVHCGFEATAVTDAIKNPLKLAWTTLRGVKTDGVMAPEIPLHNARPAEYVFSSHVEKKLAEIVESEQPRRQLSAAE